MTAGAPWLADGLALALAPQPLAAVVAGVVIGLGVGTWSGAGALAAIALLMPVLAGLDTLPALVLIAGVYHGAQAGGVLGTVLAGAPGEAAAHASAADGRALVRLGHADAALRVAAWSSFAAGMVTLAMLAAAVPLVLTLAFHFGPAEYAALTLLALAGAVAWSPGSTLKALAMALMGLLLGRWLAPAGDGIDLGAGLAADGTAAFVALVLGTFLLPQAVAAWTRAGAGPGAASAAWGATAPTTAAAPADASGPGGGAPAAAVGSAPPGDDGRGRDLRRALPAIGRGTAVGALLGVLPGGGAVLAAFTSLALERRIAAAPGEAAVGAGSVRGVAGPESANNAGAQAAFLPALALGLPPNAVMALLIGTLAVHGVTPGPSLATERPGLLWGLVAAMAIGHGLLLAMGLLVARWSSTRRGSDGPRPAPGWASAAAWSAWLALAVLGMGLLPSGPAVVALATGVALAAVGLQRLGCPAAPLVLGVVLWPSLEHPLLRLLARDGGPALGDRPVAIGLVAVAAAWVAAVALARLRRRRAGARPAGSPTAVGPAD